MAMAKKVSVVHRGVLYLLPVDEDNGILLSCLKSALPEASGLHMKNKNGALEVVQCTSEKLYPPDGIWSDKAYSPTLPESEKKKKKDSRTLQKEINEDIELNETKYKEENVRLFGLLEYKKSLHLQMTGNNLDIVSLTSYHGEKLRSGVKMTRVYPCLADKSLMVEFRNAHREAKELAPKVTTDDEFSSS